MPRLNEQKLLRRMRQRVGGLALPAPIYEGDEVTWLPIYRISSKPPFGYGPDEDNPKWWKPIPEQLEALEAAKQHLKTYSYRAVAEWLSKETGRKISYNGLRTRLSKERDVSNNFRSSQELARRLAEAVEETEKFERQIFGRREVRDSEGTLRTGRGYSREDAEGED